MYGLHELHVCTASIVSKGYMSPGHVHVGRQDEEPTEIVIFVTA